MGSPGVTVRAGGGVGAGTPEDARGGPRDSATSARLKSHGYAWWRAPLWMGVDAASWVRLLSANGFRVSVGHLPRAAVVTGGAVSTSLVRLFGGAAASASASPVPADPVVILGHWRTGTTHLHGLLHATGLFGAPALQQVFLPHHPAWAARLIHPLTRVAGHGKRPMDDVVIDDEGPQEDEFGLLLRGAPSPYEALLFPRAHHHWRRLTTEGYAPEELARRRQAVEEHVLRVAGDTGRRRLLLKSPTYTGQIDLLLSLFPRARFIHLVRHPDEIFPSTAWMLRALRHTQGLQRSDEGDIEDLVVENLRRMYAGYRRHAPTLPEGCLTTVRYEQLVETPVETVRTILELVGIEPNEDVLRRVEHRVRALSGYAANRHRITEAQCDRLREAWDFYFRDFGYED